MLLRADNLVDVGAKMAWRALPILSESLFFWDDECIVFNHLSGDTHLLSALAGQILLKLQQAPLYAASLAMEAMEAMDATDAMLPSSTQSGHEFDDILAELSALALIERV